MNPKIARFLEEHQPATPCLVIDLEVVEQKYRELAAAIPEARIYYAVKAAPAPEIVSLLARLGSRFDVASPQEIELCLEAGARPEELSYGATMKKLPDIEYAYDVGVRMFAFDSEEEMRKLSKAAPGTEVVCRILTDNEGADWPLSRKFGCHLDMAHDLMVAASRSGLDPCGVAFHVGSQQRVPSQWDVAIAQTARLFTGLEAVGVPQRLVNVGGGFPSQYRSSIPPIDAYGAAIMRAMTHYFGDRVPEMIVEPGRYIAGDAGVIRSEVILVSKKSYAEDKRWVYLDVGIFGGLAEAQGEAIQYRLRSSRDGGPTGPVVLAGPTCDSVDIMYEHADYRLPLDLQAGDTVDILSAGAYTTTYSTIGFNGFAPLTTYCIS